jgi:iduronate 2-sulfatase
MANERFSRRGFLHSSMAALASPLVAAKEERKRNVLFIASDDLNNCLGCYGHTIVQTPNIDGIAQAGVRFNHSYCQFPLCSPSRSSLMTGLAPDTTKVWDLKTHFRKALPDVVTLPQLFQRNGYFTARAGKIYHYGVPRDIGTPGLDDPASWNETANPAGVDHTREESELTNYTPKRGLGSSIGFHVSEAPDNQHTDSMVADAIIGMMEKHKNDPWFLGAGFYRPHVPWIAPAKYFDLYPMDRIQAPLFEESEMHMAPEWAYFTKPANWGMTVQQRRDAIRAYYASISFMDAQVGRLLRALDRLGLTANTTIMFWGDNGYHLGEHGQWMKQTVFEPASRIPLLIGGAGVPARAQASQRTVELLDLYPTLADVCGLNNAPVGLQGRNIAPLLRNPRARWEHPAISQVLRHSGEKRVMGYSLRTERYWYTFWNAGAEGEELYDYEAEPRELKNLANDPASAGLKRKFKAELTGICRARGMAKS